MNYEQALTKFLVELTKREKRHINDNYTNLTPARFAVVFGRKFDKVLKISNSSTVFAFIKKNNGAILKPASWKSPEPKQYERGNIFNDDPLEGTGVYGVDYLNVGVIK